MSERKIGGDVAVRRARAPVYGRRGMVVCGHSAASLAGIATMRRGGNVVDAMISASASLAVTISNATALGGDFFLLFHEAKSGRTYGLNASGVAPAAAKPEHYTDGIKAHGPMAAVVPGIVRGWEALHQRFGKLKWGHLFDDPIDLAEKGSVSQVLADRIPENAAGLAADPGCAALFLPDGRPLPVGATLRQPALAKTLRAIASQGADSFYLGETAERIGRYFAARGGLMQAADLAAYKPMWVEPIASNYRGHEIQVMPPNSYGVLLPLQLTGLSALTSQELTKDPARRLGYQMSAMKAAFEHGVPWIADPDSVPKASERLLGLDMAAKMQAAVRAVAPNTRFPDKGGTSCLLVADSEGNAICMVQSVFNVFGCMFMEPSSGVLFNNRMQGFTHEPGKPNSIAGGKRPAHTLSPVIVRHDGRVRYIVASPGGLSQTLTNTQVLTHLIDGGTDVATAVEAPRWCNTKSGDFLIEPEFSESVIPILATMGHAARRADDAYFYGSAKALEILPTGNLAGAADHRREAFALGW
jgi:gamma-glutamyltranspeptidase